MINIASLRELDELESRHARSQEPTRAEVELVLTDGYAEALELEAKRLEVARRLQAARDKAEKDALAEELETCGRQLGLLRRRLADTSRLFGRNPLSDLSA